MPSAYGYKTISRGIAPAAFTFFEVLAALVIVSISLLGLLRLHLGSIAMVDTAQAASQAVFLAREKLAEAAALGYPEIGVSSGLADNDTLKMRWRTEVSECELPELVEAGQLYPSISDVRATSLLVAKAVAAQAIGEGLADPIDDLDGAIEAAMWFPEYLPYRPA